MTPGKYNFPPHRRGDTFNGHTFTILEDSLPADFSGATAKIQLRRNAYSDVALQWATGGFGISFDTNKVIMEPKPGTDMDLEPGLYLYDLQIIKIGGIVNTYVEGYFEIVNDITR